jgi:hypothetical protein
MHLCSSSYHHLHDKSTSMTPRDAFVLPLLRRCRSFWNSKMESRAGTPFLGPPRVHLSGPISNYAAYQGSVCVCGYFGRSPSCMVDLLGTKMDIRIHPFRVWRRPLAIIKYPISARPVLRPVSLISHDSDTRKTVSAIDR